MIYKQWLYAHFWNVKAWLTSVLVNAYDLYYFSQIMQIVNAIAMMEIDIFVKWLPICFDVLGVKYNLSFTRKKTWAFLGLQVEKFLYYSKYVLCAFAWVWCHEKCKCVEEKDISWTQLNMVWLNMMHIALGPTNKNPFSI